MRHACFSLSLAVLSISGAIGQAHASPLMLSITGYADGVPVNYVTDVSSGFSGVTLPLSSVMYGPLEDRLISLNSSIDLTATLFNSSHNLASMGLDGQITGSVGNMPYDYSIDPTGAVRGTSMPGVVTLGSGVDPSTIPVWFLTLGAYVSGDLTGGAQSYLPVNLAVYPYSSEAAQVQPAPVPEPASVVIFLSCAAAGMILRRRRRV